MNVYHVYDILSQIVYAGPKPHSTTMIKEARKGYEASERLYTLLNKASLLKYPLEFQIE